MATRGHPAKTVPPSESPTSQLWRTVSIFLPGPVREASKEGLLRTLVYLMLAVTVLPLLVAFLAAFWLSMIRDYVRLDFVQSLRATYVKSIHEGFSIDELVARKLDYVLPIAVHLQPNAEAVNIPIYLEPRQHAQITLTAVWASAPEAAVCRYEEVGWKRKLVAVKLGDLNLKECETTHNGACPIALDRAWWQENGSRYGQYKDAMPPLTIARADGVGHVCAEIQIDGYVMVYKDFY